MMESLKGKLTEEEARKLLSIHQIEVTPQATLDVLIEKHIDQTIISWKEKGYIKQNPVEKAEEMYSKYVRDDEFYQHMTSQLLSLQHDAIINLKKQLEEKKE